MERQIYGHFKKYHPLSIYFPALKPSPSLMSSMALYHNNLYHAGFTDKEYDLKSAHYQYILLCVNGHLSSMKSVLFA